MGLIIVGVVGVINRMSLNGRECNGIISVSKMREREGQTDRQRANKQTKKGGRGGGERYAPLRHDSAETDRRTDRQRAKEEQKTRLLDLLHWGISGIHTIIKQ